MLIMTRDDRVRKVRKYWRKLSWSLDLKFSWKMEVFFLVIVKTDATRARMSPSFHRGKMAVKAKKRKEEQDRTSYFFSVLRFYWLKCGFVSCPPLPCRSAQCNVWLAEENRASPWRAGLVPEGSQLAPAGESRQLLCSSYPEKKDCMERWTFPHRDIRLSPHETVRKVLLQNGWP